MNRLKSYMPAPVEIHGQQQMLYFQNFIGRARVVNWQATNLFNRRGFFINGPAVVVERSEKWHCLRVRDSKPTIEMKMAHLTFKDAFAVVPTSRRGDYHDVIARDEADIILLKMVL
ncbi:MAG TPA: hypothetical protein VHL98_21985 [Microvirga sp.]|nr:hypothetical protein [Microvirga sp.]